MTAYFVRFLGFVPLFYLNLFFLIFGLSCPYTSQFLFHSSSFSFPGGSPEKRPVTSSCGLSRPSQPLHTRPWSSPPTSGVRKTLLISAADLKPVGDAFQATPFGYLGVYLLLSWQGFSSLVSSRLSPSQIQHTVWGWLAFSSLFWGVCEEACHLALL